MKLDFPGQILKNTQI